ncbi:MAG: zinc ribbon domain-containing protein [Gammaproteobacteria bacterium]|nr:zinc ribbon domain-containing protein [Gammaproteobacteria bacterium]
MPIYEYECGACGAQHEFIQKFSEGPKRKCPSCGKSRLRKRVSAAAFHLKGTGWYETDFKNSKKAKANGDATSSDSSSDSSGGEKKSSSDSGGESSSKSESKSSDSKPKGDSSAAAGA